MIRLWRDAIARLKQRLRLWLEVETAPDVTVAALAREFRASERQRSSVETRLTLFENDRERIVRTMLDNLSREVEEQLTGRFSVVLYREVALRFERELQDRIVKAIAQQAPGIMREYSVVPLPEIQDAVHRCVQGVVSQWLTSLIGVGSLTLGVPDPKG